MNNSYNNIGNNTIFGDNSSIDNIKKSKKQYNANKIFGDETEINEEKNNEKEYNNRNNLKNKRISNQTDFNNIFGDS